MAVVTIRTGDPCGCCATPMPNPAGVCLRCGSPTGISCFVWPEGTYPSHLAMRDEEIALRRRLDEIDAQLTQKKAQYDRDSIEAFRRQAASSVKTIWRMLVGLYMFMVAAGIYLVIQGDVGTGVRMIVWACFCFMIASTSRVTVDKLRQNESRWANE